MDTILRPSLITEHWRAVKTPSYQVRFKIGEGTQRGWKPLLSKANRTILPQGITVREMRGNVRIFMHFLVLMTLCIERLLICSTGPNIQLRQLGYTRIFTLMKYRMKESDASGKTGRSGRPQIAPIGPKTVSALPFGDYWNICSWQGRFSPASCLLLYSRKCRTLQTSPLRRRTTRFFIPSVIFIVMHTNESIRTLKAV